jgi:transportin-1
MSWQPVAEGVQQIVTVLENAQNTSREVQEQLLIAYESFKKIPDYNSYLSYIFVHLGSQVSEEVRFSAGIALKNNITIVGANQYVKEEIVKSIADSNKIMRRSCAIVMTEILKKNGYDDWPGLVEFLANCLDNVDPNIVDGAFQALLYICEDHGPKMNADEARDLYILLPKFLSSFNSPTKSSRLYALTGISRLIHLQPKCMIQNMSNFMEGFFYLAQLDNDEDIRSRIITVFLRLCSSRICIEAVRPFLPKVVLFMILCMQEGSMDVKTHAGEFWKLISEYDEISLDCVTPHLGNLLSTLLNCMMFTDEQLIEKGVALQDNAHIPDKPSETNVVYGVTVEEEDEDEDDGEGWSLRKCAAEGLDYISRPFVFGFIDELMPLIMSGLQNDDWRIKESALYALGCVSIGQYHAIKQYLPNFLPFVFELSSHGNPLVRASSLWVLSRYNKWIMCQKTAENNHFKTLIEAILNRMKDNNKDVQRAAVIAIQDICDESHENIIPYASIILNVFAEAMRYYQKTNLQRLLNSIGAVSCAMGVHFSEKQYTSVIMPPLLELWECTEDDNPEIFALFNCFIHISKALQNEFVPFAPQIYFRSLKMIEKYLIEVNAANQADDDFPDPEFVMCPLDMIASLCNCFGSNMSGVIDQSNFMHLFVELLKDKDYFIAQSKFALIGDMAKNIPDTLSPILNFSLPILITNIKTTRWQDTCNNALWALGEILVAYSESKYSNDPPTFIAPYLEDMLTYSFHIIGRDDVYELLETVAVLIGRIAWICPRLLIDSQFKLKDVMITFLTNIRSLGDSPEKSDALKGLCGVVKLNPEVIFDDIPLVLDVILDYSGKDEELIMMISSVLNYLKSLTNQREGGWEGVVKLLPKSLTVKLFEFYKIPL